MHLNIQIRFLGLAYDHKMASQIRRRVASLQRRAVRMTSFRAILEKRNVAGGVAADVYQVTLDVALPQRELVVCKGHTSDRNYATVSEALDDAFAAVEKQIAAHANVLRESASIATRWPTLHSIRRATTSIGAI